MTNPFGRLLPRRIATQTAAVVVSSVVLIQVAVVVYLGLEEDRRRGQVHPGTVVRMISASAPGEARARIVADAARAFPDMELQLLHGPPSGIVPREAEPPGRRHLPPPLEGIADGAQVVMLGPPGPPRDRGEPPRGPPGGPPMGGRVAVGLEDGDWILLTDRPPPPPPFFFLGPWTLSIVFAALSSVLLGLWAARALVGPLRALAAAARDFDIEGEAAPLPRRGPEEVRVAAAAFDAMRLRIRSLVEDRTRMLAAMGHDLRTPITRLRLRSEFVGDEAMRAEILRDLTGMTDMIEGALTYLAEGRHKEAPTLVDLSATIQTICDDWSDLGRDVAYDGPDHLVRRVRRVSMERALSNLVDNALKYGTRCVVRLRGAGDGGTLIEVEDDGPGIAEDLRAAMLKPFVRGDAARNMDDQGGFGLGLAIVEAVVSGHGGTLAFQDVDPHGLRVAITLPPEGRKGASA